MLLSGEVHLSTVAMAAKEIAKDEGVLDRIRGKTYREVERMLADGAREFRFAAGPAFREKFERVRALLSGKRPEGVMPEQVLETPLAEYLERHVPARPVRVEHSPAGSGEQSRKAPAAVRRAVWRRDGGRCTFEGSDGHRCGSMWDVEIHHVDLYCRGGDHRLGNLRLFCRAHDQRQAERDLGTAWMAPFVRRE